MDSKTAMQLRNAGIRPESIPPGTLLGGRPIDAAEEIAKPKSRVEVESCPNGTVRLVIPGPPPGKPRMIQSDKWRKRKETDKYWAWANAVKAAVAGCIPAAETVAEVNWTAFFEPPPSWSKKKRVAAIGTAHRTKPDRDNLDKTILDCLWPKGDSAIAAGTIRKVWDWKARLEVEIITESKPAMVERGK